MKNKRYSITIIVFMILLTTIFFNYQKSESLVDAQTSSVNVSFLGDSITAGDLSYRCWLYRYLYNDGLATKNGGGKVKFVGVNGVDPNPYTNIIGNFYQRAYPRDPFSDDIGKPFCDDWSIKPSAPDVHLHNAKGGISLGGLVDSLPSIYAAMDTSANSRIDIAFIHIGTNNVWNGISDADAMGLVHGDKGSFKASINSLRARNSNVRIVIAQIINGLGTSNMPSGIATLNKYIAEASRYSTTSSPVYVVDLYSGFDYNTMTGDKVHPNRSGMKWMADRIYPVLKPLILNQPIINSSPRVTTEPSTIPIRTTTPTITPTASNTVSPQPTSRTEYDFTLDGQVNSSDVKVLLDAWSQ